MRILITATHSSFQWLLDGSYSTANSKNFNFVVNQFLININFTVCSQDTLCTTIFIDVSPGCFLSRGTAIINGSAVDTRSGKTAGGPSTDNWSSVDCESMIERACWINYKPVTNDYWPIGRGFIQPAANTGEQSCMCHTCIMHTSQVRVIPGGYILSTVTHHSTEVKSCLTATRFEGHYTPDVRVERGAHYQNFWHTAGISGLIIRNHGSCRNQDVVRCIPLYAHSEISRPTLNKCIIRPFYRTIDHLKNFTW